MIEMVLEEAHGDFNSTAEILLSMVGEMDENSGKAGRFKLAYLPHKQSLFYIPK